jgi:hypothetical protein
LVLADGRFVTASEQENPDLFWAIRGEAATGVVTYQLTVHTDYAGPMLAHRTRARGDALVS